MKKLALIVALSAGVAVAVPAQASKPENPGSQRSTQGSAHERSSAHRGSSATSHKGKGKRKSRCAPRAVAYVAFGDYVSSTLTQTQGVATTDSTRDDRWSGELVVAVKRTNRHARADKGATKTYTLTDARIRLADRDGDGTRDLPVAGDRTRIKGKITRLNRGCDATGFEPELKIRSVGFHKPKAAQTPAPVPVPAP